MRVSYVPINPRVEVMLVDWMDFWEVIICDKYHKEEELGYCNIMNHGKRIKAYSSKELDKHLKLIEKFYN